MNSSYGFQESSKSEYQSKPHLYSPNTLQYECMHASLPPEHLDEFDQHSVFRSLFVISFVHIYFRLKCNLLCSHPSYPLHVSAGYGHHQVFILLKIVALYVKMMYHVLTRYFIIKINLI
jgi:hypothetical protein